jgi:hypothetical protein
LRMKLLVLIVFSLSLLLINQSIAQVQVSGQILQRAEFLHGYGQLMEPGLKPGAFVGQRSRVNINYTDEKFRAVVSAQDIRIWGSTPQVKFTDAFLSAHEAWAEYFITNNFSVKAGRQELEYDNARFLGNLDWALQARAHDILVIKYEGTNYLLHGGAAWNQEAPILSGTFYGLENQYKTAQYIRYQQKIMNFSFSTFFWNNGVQARETGPQGNTIEKINFSQTFGLPMMEYTLGNLSLNSFYYHQAGLDARNRRLNANNIMLEASYLFPVIDTIPNSLRLSIGGEILSGTSQLEPNGNRNFSYSPLYGTNHRYNGYMDYFYVGGRHFNSVGLQDYYIRARYDFNPRVFVGLNGHYFRSAAAIADRNNPGQAMSPYLGTELDFTAGVIFTGAISLQAGYSQMFASESFQMLRGGDRGIPQYWAYLMMLYRPGMKNRFAGLKF